MNHNFTSSASQSSILKPYNSKRFKQSGNFMATVSNRGDLKLDHVTSRRGIGWFLESIGKYAVDFSANFLTKGKKGPQLHRTVQEGLKDGASLKVCNNQEKKRPKIRSTEKETTKMEKTQEEINMMKLRNGIAPETLEPISLSKFPSEQVEEKTFSMPNRTRIMIRSRL